MDRARLAQAGRGHYDWMIGLLLAAACHGFVLVGIQPGPAAPLTVSAAGRDWIEVSLVAPAPGAMAEPEPATALPSPAPPPPPEIIETESQRELLPLPLPEPEQKAAPPAPPPPEELAPAARQDTELMVAEAAPPPPREALPSATPPSLLEPSPERVVEAAAGPLTPFADAVTVSEPHYRRRARLYYPGEARRRKQTGLVVLSLHINANGRAESVQVKQSSGFSLLDQAACDMALQSEYVPARSGSRAVPSRTEATYRFVLKNI